MPRIEDPTHEQNVAKLKSMADEIMAIANKMESTGEHAEVFLSLTVQHEDGIQTQNVCLGGLGIVATHICDIVTGIPEDLVPVIMAILATKVQGVELEDILDELADPECDCPNCQKRRGKDPIPAPGSETLN